MTDDVRRLLGGYATGTLSDEEKQVLFDAALHDDALFAALADEHALKDLLDDSGVRAQLLQATEDPRFSVAAALREWFEHPKSKVLVTIGALLLCVIGFNQVRARFKPSTTTLAELRRPTSPITAPSASSESTAATSAQLGEQPRTSPSQTPQQVGPESSATRSSADARSEKTGDQSAMLRDNTVPAPPMQASPAAPVPPAVSAPSENSFVAGSPAIAAGSPAARSGPARVGRGSGVMSADSAQSDEGLQLSGTGVGAFQRAAGTSVTPLRYELLRKGAAGEFQSVPADYLFLPGDVVRLRVTSSRDGAAAVSSGASSTTVSRNFVANNWTEIPQSGGIAITPDTAKLVVFFAPLDEVTSNLLETNETRAKRTARPSVSLEIPIRLRKP